MQWIEAVNKRGGAGTNQAGSDEHRGQRQNCLPVHAQGGGPQLARMAAEWAG